MRELAVYENDCVLASVESELSNTLKTADLHIPRWLQVIDVGIGFAKTFEHNIQLLRPENISHIKSSLGARPMLVGPSRKRFLGTLLSQQGIDDEVETRDWATAGACCASILGGANILRVHNVKGVRSTCEIFYACVNSN